MQTNQTPHDPAPAVGFTLSNPGWNRWNGQNVETTASLAKTGSDLGVAFRESALTIMLIALSEAAEHILYYMYQLVVITRGVYL